MNTDKNPFHDKRSLRALLLSGMVYEGQIVPPMAGQKAKSISTLMHTVDALVESTDEGRIRLR